MWEAGGCPLLGAPFPGGRVTRGQAAAGTQAQRAHSRSGCLQALRQGSPGGSPPLWPRRPGRGNKCVCVCVRGAVPRAGARRPVCTAGCRTREGQAAGRPEVSLRRGPRPGQHAGARGRPRRAPGQSRLLCFPDPTGGTPARRCGRPAPGPRTRPPARGPEPAPPSTVPPHGRTHLQHVREVQRDALQQGPVGPPPLGLAGGHVQVALADQGPHLLQRSACVHIVAEGFVHRRLPAVKAAGGGRGDVSGGQGTAVTPGRRRLTSRSALPPPPPTFRTGR